MRKTPVLLPVFLVVMIAGCGDDDGSSITASVASSTTAATAMTAAPDPSSTTTLAVSEVVPDPAPMGTIFFARIESDGETNIWSLDTSTWEETRLTDTSVAMFPDVSPDRTRIAFTTFGEDEYVWVMDPDGAHPRQITDTSSAAASWNPDGLSLVMNCDSHGEPIDVPDLCTVQADGSGLAQVLDNDSVGDAEPQWSPDGTRILFTSDRTGTFDLYVLHVVSGEVRALISTPGDRGAGRWSPDGSMVVFSELTEDGSYDIFLFRGVGDVVRLTDWVGIDDAPDFSPDGTRIVFISDMGGTLDLWAFNLDGTEVQRLTSSDGLDISPSWG